MSANPDEYSRCEAKRMVQEIPDILLGKVRAAVRPFGIKITPAGGKPGYGIEYFVSQGNGAVRRKTFVDACLLAYKWRDQKLARQSHR